MGEAPICRSVDPPNATRPIVIWTNVASHHVETRFDSLPRLLRRSRDGDPEDGVRTGRRDVLGRRTGRTRPEKDTRLSAVLINAMAP
jgi:hypothetical protein